MLNSLQTIKQEQFLNALLDELEKIEERFKRETLVKKRKTIRFNQTVAV